MVKQAIIGFVLVLLVCCSSLARNTNDLHTSGRLVEAKAFVKKQKMNNKYALLVDMSIHSGKKRMFLVDLKKDSIINQAICSHGSCDGENGMGYNDVKVNFSNTVSSHCSSLGRYRIGKRSYSNWGINVHYKLHGLDSTNSNAYKRVVVLHSYSLVPDMQTFPVPAPTSWGCPMVSNKMMRSLDKLLKKEKNVLLWIYN